MSKGAKPDTWMPLYIGDYLKDTGRLTTEQHGAYLLLIMDYWTNGAPSDDDDELSAITRLDLKTWRKHRSKIQRFFQVEGGHWRHKRIDEELESAQGKSDKAAEKASAAARARWDKERGKHPDPDTPSTPPSNAKPHAQAYAQSMLEECPSPSPSESRTDPNGSGGQPPSDGLFGSSPSDDRSRAWKLGLKVLMDRGGYSEARARPMVGKWVKANDPAHVSQAAEAAWHAGTLDPVSYITEALKRISAEALDPLKHPSEARQRMWMQDFRTSPRDWREHERGPRPGEPGCRVSAEIQREFGVDPAKPREVRGAA